MIKIASDRFILKPNRLRFNDSACTGHCTQCNSDGCSCFKGHCLEDTVIPHFDDPENPIEPDEKNFRQEEFFVDTSI